MELTSSLFLQFSLQSSFSGQVLEESWTLTFCSSLPALQHLKTSNLFFIFSKDNVLFTVLPPFVLGVFDQFVGARMLDRYPELYTLGQHNKSVR